MYIIGVDNMVEHGIRIQVANYFKLGGCQSHSLDDESTPVCNCCTKTRLDGQDVWAEEDGSSAQ